MPTLLDPPLSMPTLEAALLPCAERLALALHGHGHVLSSDVRDSLAILQGLTRDSIGGDALASEAAFLAAAILDPTTGVQGAPALLQGPVDDLLRLLTPAGFMAPYELPTGGFGIWG